MTKDFIEEALGLLERQDAAPRAEFTDSLRGRFLDEALGVAAPEPAPSRRARPRLWLPIAAAAAVLAIVGAFLVIPKPPSASAVIAEARANFGDLPPLRAVVEKIIPASQLETEVGAPVPDDWRVVTSIDFQDDLTWRREFLKDVHDPFTPEGTTGSYTVSTASTQLLFDPVSGTAAVDPAPKWTPDQSRLQALMEISPTFDQASPVIDRAVQGCQVIEGDSRLGRPASHLRCTVEGEASQADVWIDDATGVVLSLSLPNGIRFEVLALEEQPTFPAGTFSTDTADVATTAGPSPTIGASQTGLEIGQTVPTWTLPLVDGGQFDLASLRGRPTIVYVWATWCGPTCSGGDPASDPLVAMDQAFSEHGEELGVVTLALPDQPKPVRAAIDAAGLSVPTVVASDPRETELPSKLWRSLQGVPVLVVIDASGRLSGFYFGDLQAEDIRQVVDAVLGGKPLPDIGGKTQQQLPS